MAEDFEDLYDLDNMSDDELKEFVLQELSEYPEIDVDDIEVAVRHGAVTLTGRVGTEQEQQEPERILVDVLGIREVTNELVVDEVRRFENSEAADDAAAETMASNPGMTASSPRTSDEAEHLMENLDAEQFGTEDPHEATMRGTAYEPPDHPVQEGGSGDDH